MVLRGKRFLITQPMIHGLNGSTIVALELAEYLQSEGAQVTVYTYVYDNPAKEFFVAKNIEVKVAKDNPEFTLGDFDYIWSHSQVMPISIIRALGAKHPRRMPKFIFHHMSPLDTIPDERPYIYEFEDKLAALSLFISKNTQESQKGYFARGSNKALFKNPAPVAFSQLDYTPNETLKRVLIVSNHPPKELIAAKKMLIEKGIEVVSFGEQSEKYSLITPEVISRFDVVITIGKTAQYCLTAGVPVYIYDHYGGQGYLNKQNYTAATDWNLAGRNSEHRTAHYLVKDIIGRYEEAVVYQTENRTKFIEEFSIDKVLAKTLKEAKAHWVHGFDRRYMNTVISAQKFARIRFEVGVGESNSSKQNYRLRGEVEALQDENNRIKKQLESKKNEIYDIYNSKRLKLIALAVKPVVLTKKLVKKITRR